MKKLSLVLLTACLLVAACGGAEFTGGGGNPVGDASSDGTPGQAGTGGSAGKDAAPDTPADSTGGMAGSAGDANTPDTDSTAGTGGSSGSAGDSSLDTDVPDTVTLDSADGTAGSAGDTGPEVDTGPDVVNPCTGIYLQIDTVGSGGVLGSGAGPITATTYNVHGTSSTNHLVVSISLVNNLSGDFTTPQATSALEAVVIRCQDPNGTPSFTTACGGPLTLTAGEVSCSPGCYSAFGGVTKMQIQLDPVAPGQVRVGIDPSSVSICGDQSTVPTYIVQ